MKNKTFATAYILTVLAGFAVLREMSTPDDYFAWFIVMTIALTLIFTTQKVLSNKE